MPRFSQYKNQVPRLYPSFHWLYATLHHNACALYGIAGIQRWSLCCCNPIWIVFAMRCTLLVALCFKKHCCDFPNSRLKQLQYEMRSAAHNARTRTIASGRPHRVHAAVELDVDVP